jgi:hypothetical protein
MVSAPNTSISSSADWKREHAMAQIPCSRLLHLPTRRSVLAGLALAGIAPAALAAEVIDRLGIPGPIAFDGADYALAWSSHPSPAYYKQEYLPAGQVTASYTSMLIVELVTGGASVASAVAAQTRMLNARKATDPLVNFALLQNQKTGEVLLDFVLGTATPRRVVEWNAYRYAPYRASNGQEGVILLAISRRAYGDDDAKTFLGGLKQSRVATMNAFARLPLPVVKLAR